ncbi:hypothetical protein CH371_15465 [Leptospira wolffii]|uniref:Imelysin-like domain-containing protein n=1 Tax=Leptospira wolffii TaxID=409998 RepID=A0A2M9Z8Z3_9LEPT|nr:imelysin family protein [Leptospira wolffii]PJZ64901.1 hypothetical protein CH371_15465 [Leptospira wolffii]
MISLYKKTAFTIALFFGISGCGGGGGSNLLPFAFLFQAEPNYTEFLQYNGTNVIVPALDALRTSTGNLETSATTYYNTPNQFNFDDLRSKWGLAKTELKKVETFFFGPADLPTSKSFYTRLDGFKRTGARPSSTSVTNVINSAGCTQVSTTLNKANLTNCTFQYKGFEALEMLLYSGALPLDPSTKEDSPTSHSANSGSQRRMDYIKALAEVINQDANNLYNEWNPSGNNFLGNFIAGNGYYFRSQGESFDTYIQAIGALTNQVQDEKLGHPACLSVSCTGSTNVPIPDFAEAVYSRTSYKDLYNNVLGIESAYLGIVSDPDNKSMSLMVAAQNPTLDTNIQNAITSLKATLNNKVTASADLYAEISADGNVAGGSSVTNNVKPIWLLAQTLKNYLTVDAFSLLGVPNLPSSNDGD